MTSIWSNAFGALLFWIFVVYLDIIYIEENLPHQGSLMNYSKCAQLCNLHQDIEDFPNPKKLLCALLFSVSSSPGGTSGKEPTCQCQRYKRCGFNSWDKKIPWSRKWQPTPVLLHGNFHDRGAWWATVYGGHKESDMTKWSQFHVPIPSS